MGFTDEITTSVKDFLSGDYEIREGSLIPSVEDVPFGKVAFKVNLTALYIDMRKSTELLIQRDEATAGKIHKSFLYVASRAVRFCDGQIRSFNGDSLLALWPARYKSEITACVKSAMIMKWLLTVHLKPLFAAYQEIDFGIGVDWGTVYIARAGLPRDANNNDLIFMGKCINFAVRLGEQAKAPFHIEVSPEVQGNLEDPYLTSTVDGKKVEIWHDGRMKWKGSDVATKLTSWYQEI